MKPILDANGQPAVSAERVRMEKQSRFNPLRSLTPASLARQLEAFQRGEMRDLAWTMQWMEDHDDMIGSVADKAKSAVARYGYDVLIHDEIDEADTAMAEAQQAVLQKFYQNLQCGHAVEREERGGMRLLLKQMMDAFGKGYAMHHVIWKPDAANGLSAEVNFVPLWFFENMQGDIRFLDSAWSWNGKELDSEELGGRGAWLVSRGRGVMLACAIAWMFKHIPLQDWLTYCARHGMPAFLGKTQSEFGSDGWNGMADAVANMGAEWGGVINQTDAIEVLNLSAQGQMPYEALVERMDRAFAILWRGGDLSTLSRGDAVGANPQTADSDELDGDNSLWAGETIDRQLGRAVIDYYFGEDAPMLAYLQVGTATRDDVEKDLKVIESGVKLGVPVSKNYFSQKFGVPMADEGDELLGGKTPNSKLQTPSPDDARQEDDTKADAAEEDDATVANEALDGQTALVMNSLSRVLGVRPAMLAPVLPLMDQIADASGEMDYDAFLDFVEDAALSLPEFFDPAFAGDLANELEAAMGTGAVTGIRDALRKVES